MIEWTIESLKPTHLRDKFSSGAPSLDQYIRLLATQYEKRDIARNIVATVSGSHEVIGYYSLAASGIEFEHFPALESHRLPRHPIPVVLLGRLAVDSHFQGKLLGSQLLHHAVCKTIAVSDELGVYAIRTDAISNTAATFYSKFGFLPLQHQPLKLYLPLKTAKQLTERGLSS
jgi:GNAT superfamily N-acetyltransferase